MGAGFAKLDCTPAPVPMGPAVALMFPPSVRFPPSEKALTASSLLSTTTKSVMSAPICRPHPTPAVPIHDGADHSPVGRREMTRPDPAFPEKTKPALRTWNTARPDVAALVSLRLVASQHQSPARSPLARCRTAFGIAFSADSGWVGSAKMLQQ